MNRPNESAPLRHVAAAILAGGRATRMGGLDKPSLVIGSDEGDTILARQLAALRPLTDEILLVVDRPGRLPGVPGLREIVDEHPGAGPLAALGTALFATTRAQLLLVAGDMPSLSTAALRLLLTTALEADACVPLVGGRRQPLHARYAQRLLPTVRECLAAGERSLQALLDRIEPALFDEAALRAVDPALRSFDGVNDPEQLALARRSLDER